MWNRVLPLFVAVVATAAAGVGLASAVIPATDPDSEAPDTLAPKPGSHSLERSARDAKDGTSYGVEVSESKTGRVCLSAGEVVSGKVGGSRPDAPSESCGSLSGRDADRALVGALSENGKLIIHGVAGPDVTRVTVGGEDVSLSPRRAYLALREGEQTDLPKYPVVVTLKSGGKVVYPWDWTIPSSTETGLSGSCSQEDQEIEEERSTVQVIS